MIPLTPHDSGTTLMVRAQPNARKNGILGERDGALRIGVTVGPEKGKANAAIALILAEVLGCRGSSILLVAGETSRDKRFLILDQTPNRILERLKATIAAG